MNDWLIGLSEHPRTDEELFQESIDRLPVPELKKLAFDLDPLSFPTEIDEMGDKIHLAIRQGQELAHEHPVLEKIAFLPALVAGAGRVLGGGGVKAIAGGIAKDMAVSAAGNKIMGALKPAAPTAAAAGEVAGGGFKYAFAGQMLSSLGKSGGGLLQRATAYTVKNPGTALTAAGAIGGAMMAPRDPQTGEKQYVRGALMGGGAAAGINALSNGAIANKMRSSVMNRNNPILGDKVRQYAMNSSAAVRGKAPTGGVTVNGQTQYSSPAVPASPVAASASPTPVATSAAPVEAAPYMGGPNMRGPAAMHTSGPVAGAIKVAHRQFETMSSAEQILYVAQLDALEKKAYVGPDQLVGGLLGYSNGRRQAERGESHTFGGAQLASLLLPGGAGYQVGRAIGHNNHSHKEKKANRQTLTYDPATKTFTRQHLDMSPGSEAVMASGAKPIPTGTTEPVKNNMTHAGPGLAPFGSPEYTQTRIERVRAKNGFNPDLSQTIRSKVAPTPAPVTPMSAAASPAGAAQYGSREYFQQRLQQAGIGRAAPPPIPARVPGAMGGVAGIGAAAAKPTTSGAGLLGKTLARR